MRELVNHGVRERERVAAQRRGKERIVEPAERAERRRGAEARVEAARGEGALLTARLVEVEVALVRHASDDGKPPGVRLELVAVGAGEHEDERVAVERAEGREALAGGEAERVVRERARREHEGEFGLERRRRGRIGGERRDGVRRARIFPSSQPARRR